MRELQSWRGNLAVVVVAAGAVLVCAVAMAQATQAEKAAEGLDKDRILEPLVLPEPAPSRPAQPSNVLKLVGRKGKVTVIEPDGNTYELGRKSLVFWNQASEAVRSYLERMAAARTEETSEQPEEQEEAEQPGTPEGPQPDVDTPQTGEPKDEEPRGRRGRAKKAPKPDSEAIQAEQVEKLRALQNQGAWFYTDDNKPISSEELNERIERGEIEGIKTIDIFEQQWETEKVE